MDGGSAAAPDGGVAGGTAGVTTIGAPLSGGPYAIVADPSTNSVWVSFDSHVVRRIDAATGSIGTTVGQEGSYGLSDLPPLFKSPAGLAIESSGAILVADRGNHAIRRITPGPAGGVTTVVSGAAKLSSPSAVAVDEQGGIFIADTLGCAIKRFAGGQLTTVLDNSDALGRACFGGGKLYFPRGLAYDRARKLLYVAEAEADRIDVIDLNVTPPTISTLAGAGQGSVDGAVAQARFNKPQGLLLDATGGLLVVDRGNHRLRRIALARSSAVLRSDGHRAARRSALRR
jgi:DNA-binding beta-propeller fold protein YncE